MFAYCNNNPSNCKDSNGNDAIWIQESESAANKGHSGLMVQDETGCWHYFYWGPEDESAPIINLIRGVPNGSYLEPIVTDAADLTSTAEVINVLKKAENSSTSASGRADKITETYYFVGDYTATYKQAKKAIESGEKYKLLFNNCVQNVLNAFYASDSRFCHVSYGLSSSVVPNDTARKVAMLPSEQGKTPWGLILYNILFE